MLTTVTQPENTTIGDLKLEALDALKADVLSGYRGGDVDMLSGAPFEPEWVPPVVASLDDFELSRAVRERGRPTGQYETLSTNDIVKQTLVNWESVFIQFKDSKGKWRVIPTLETRLHASVRPNTYTAIPQLHRSFLQPCDYFNHNIGKLLPVKVSLPALVEEDDEEPEYSASQKGKRKAAPIDGSEP